MITTETCAPVRYPYVPQDAIALLEAEHDAVFQLFARYEMSRSDPGKKALVAEICTALSVHAQVEEEIFYPAVRAATKDRLLVPHAKARQAALKDLIAQLAGLDPELETCDAKVQLLWAGVKHHLGQVHVAMLPKAQASLGAVDLIDLGARMAARKDDLLAQAA